jgi:hypothetical protein
MISSVDCYITGKSYRAINCVNVELVSDFGNTLSSASGVNMKILISDSIFIHRFTFHLGSSTKFLFNSQQSPPPYLPRGDPTSKLMILERTKIWSHVVTGLGNANDCAGEGQDQINSEPQ